MWNGCAVKGAAIFFMLKEQILDWLNLPTLTEGNAILQSLGKPSYNDLLSIKYELEQLLYNLPEGDETPIRLRLPSSPEALPKLDHVEVLVLKARAKPLLRERSVIHGRLHYQNQKARYNTATRIKELTTQLDRIYDDIRQIESTGQVPEHLKNDQQSYIQGVKDYKLFKNLISKISRTKSQIAAATDKSKLQTDLRKLEKKASELKSKFNNLHL